MPHDGMVLERAINMLKEVGSSGQISIGKKFAGQLFEVLAHPDGRFELIPMKAVRQSAARAPGDAPSDDAWLPPGGYTQANHWALENRDALEAYAVRVAEQGTAAEQLHAYLAAHPDAAAG